MIEAVSHMTFVVKDLERAKWFFETIFDAKITYKSQKQFSKYPEMFFDINGLWIAIMQSDEAINRSYNHIAFKISEEDYELYHKRLIEHNIEFLPPRPRIDGEGRSLYFYDFDNHLFELHTGTLEQRLKSYKDNE